MANAILGLNRGLLLCYSLLFTN